jgi:DNA-binding beta-propeller fold protein YncE
MPISRRLIAVLACIPAMALHGQHQQVSSPVAGYVFDGAALRPVAGVMGGATLGGALGLGLTATAAEVSPQLDSAIVTASDGSLHLFRLGGSGPIEIAWDGAPRGPALVAYSPSGTAAAIYAAGRIRVVSGLPNAPVEAFAVAAGFAPVRAERRIASAVPQAMAVSDDAAWLLVAGMGRVRLLGASGSSAVLLEEAREVSVAFALGGHAAAVLNGAGPWLEEYSDIAAAPAERIAAPGLTAPAGLAYSADGKLVVGVARATKSVMVFDLAAARSTALACDCAPTGVSRLGNLFRLTEAGNGPVWFVDVAPSPARIAFVPARANP